MMILRIWDKVPSGRLLQHDIHPNASLLEDLTIPELSPTFRGVTEHV